ncbi:MAG: MBL fold metallo-hydrolase [Dorea longicatena]|nr:MBL fold metallo-hydrolase [Dorea longicatena]
MRKLRFYSIMIVLSLFVIGIMNVRSNAMENQRTKIHFISLYGNTDAILLESNGHFGMVDSGEDWDYPTGEDEKYPFREGTVTTKGYEQQVIHYLKQVGVKKLDFYIATHAHSDHIGSGDEILNHFPVDRLYIGRYDDSYQLDAHGENANDLYYYPEAQENRLWDNQYVYDRLIDAAKKTGVKIITDLDLDSNAIYRQFIMGKMKINIMNYERERDENGNIIPVASENENSLVVKVSAYGKNALLTGDIDPTDGATKKVADQLIEKLWETNGISDEQAEMINNRRYTTEYTTEEVIDKKAIFIPSLNEIQKVDDESVPNQGKKIQLDLMKMAHHSIDYNNTTYFLTSLNPKVVVITGHENYFNERMQECLPDVAVYATATDSAAVIAEFSNEGISTRYQKIEPEWFDMDGIYYYCDDNGRMVTDWKYIEHEWYFFDKKGAMQTGWQKINNQWYYLNDSGAMQTGWQKINNQWYYLNDSGIMQTGWQKINNQWYYLNDSGIMQTGWKKINNQWYYLNGSGVMQTGWQKIKSKWYYLNSSGVMQTGWQKIKSKKYYFNTSGVWVK